MNTKLCLPAPRRSVKSSRRPIALALVALLAPGAELLATAAGAPATNLTASAEVVIPQSVFVVPSSPKEGRNPFFPMSVPVAPPQPVPTTIGKPAEPTDVVAGLVLKGTIPSGSKRSAIINGHTLDEGEEREVKMLNGAKVLVRCEEVRADSVVVLVRGQRLELRLRSRL
jgi:hypothetical protein